MMHWFWVHVIYWGLITALFSIFPSFNKIWWSLPVFVCSYFKNYKWCWPKNLVWYWSPKYINESPDSLNRIWEGHLRTLVELTWNKHFWMKIGSAALVIYLIKFPVFYLLGTLLLVPKRAVIIMKISSLY